MAAPGKTAWLKASPTKLMRRITKNTPIGAALKPKNNTDASAWRIKPNSIKGPTAHSNKFISKISQYRQATRPK